MTPILRNQNVIGMWFLSAGPGESCTACYWVVNINLNLLSWHVVTFWWIFRMTFLKIKFSKKFVKTLHPRKDEIPRIQPIYILLTMKWSLCLVYKQHWFQIYFHILASSWMIDTWPFDPEELFVCSMLALPRSYSGQLDLREFWLDRIEESLTHQQQNKNLIRMILNFFVNKFSLRRIDW